MKHLKRAAIPALIISAFSVSAIADSTLAPVVVTATRTPTRVSEALSDVTVIEREDIERSPATSVVELLATQPGISIATTGGRGSSSSIYIRGANANHSIVLIDGQRVSSATTGTTSVEHIPLEQIERIEILRGPASSLYGADAIGGVIQIFTRKGNAGKPTPTFSFGMGSYGTTTGSVSYGGTTGDTRFSVSGGWENARGPSSVAGPTSSMFNSYSPDKDPYANNNASAHIVHNVSPTTEIGADYLETRTDKRTDEANCDPTFTVCTPYYNNRQNQNLRSYAAFASSKLLDNWKSMVRIGRSEDKTKHWQLDPLANSVSVDHFDTTQDQFTWQNDFSTSAGQFMAAVDWRKEAADTTKNLVVSSRATRALVLGYQGRWGRHELQASGRVDAIQRMDTARSGSLAYGYQISDGFSTHASVGRAFHAPTFNDLYWPVDPANFFQGNPNLRPERSFNREIALRYDGESASGQVSAYNNRVTGLMDYVAGSAPSFIGQYENLNSATLKGISSNYALALGEWAFKVSYDYLSAHDNGTGRFLQRRVPHSGALEARRSLGLFDLGAQVTYSGARYNDRANTQTLDSYTLLNLDARYHLSREWTIQAKAGNVFGTHYVLVRDTSSGNDFSTPGRTLFLNVRYAPQ